MACSAVAMAAMLFVAGVASSPVLVKMPSRELLPPKVENDTTLATELLPPPEDKDAKDVPFVLFLINVFAVKNFTAEESNDVLHNDVIQEVPGDITEEPLAMFLLIVEADNETHPVSLDEVALDLVEEGFTIEKIRKDGETRLIKVDLDSVESSASPEGNGVGKTGEEAEKTVVEADQSGKLMKVRRRRSICLSCDLDSLRIKRHLHRHRPENCPGGCGGYNSQPIYAQLQPVYPRPQPIYSQPQSYYPQPCSTCGNNGGGYNPRGGNAYAHASAQASASSYGGY